MFVRLDSGFFAYIFLTSMMEIENDRDCSIEGIEGLLIENEILLFYLTGSADAEKV